MATQFDDSINVQRGIYGGAGGNDTYILSSGMIDANAEIIITDPQSDASEVNTIQLIDGLSISSSVVASDTAQLTLSNGAVVTIYGASSFSYEIGGNPFSGTSGEIQNYTTFVGTTLGSSVPDSGTNQGGSVTIGEAIEKVSVSADVGTIEASEALDASTGSFIFTDNADVANNAVINNFSADDVINVANASDGDYSFSNNGEDVYVVFNNSGAVNMITLTGVATADDLVYDEASFESVLGFDAFVLV